MYLLKRIKAIFRGGAAISSDKLFSQIKIGVLISQRKLIKPEYNPRIL